MMTSTESVMMGSQEIAPEWDDGWFSESQIAALLAEVPTEPLTEDRSDVVTLRAIKGIQTKFVEEPEIKLTDNDPLTSAEKAAREKVFTRNEERTKAREKEHKSSNPFVIAAGNYKERARRKEERSDSQYLLDLTTKDNLHYMEQKLE